MEASKGLVPKAGISSHGLDVDGSSRLWRSSCYSRLPVETPDCRWDRERLCDVVLAWCLRIHMKVSTWTVGTLHCVESSAELIVR